MRQHRRRPLPHGVKRMVDDLLSQLATMRELLDEADGDIQEQDALSARLRISEVKVLIGDSRDCIQDLAHGRPNGE